MTVVPFTFPRTKYMEHFFAAPRTRTEVFSHPDRDETVFKRTEDISGLLDVTAELRATEYTKSKSEDMKLVAYLPSGIIENWCSVNHVSWAEFFREKKHIKALLNSPEFAYFKTGSGRI